MSTSSTSSLVRAALAGRRLLEHPFYRRWEAGEVSMGELADYAAQYCHFEDYLPGFLTTLVASLPEGPRPRRRQPGRRVGGPRTPC